MTTCDVAGTQTCRCGDSKCSQNDVRCKDPHCPFRKLFADHSWFTVVYIESNIYNLPLTAAYQKRLLENQTEIGAEFGKRSKVGVSKGKTIGTLLRNHILAADAVLQAAIQNTQDKGQKIQALYDQGDSMSQQIATALKLEQEDESHLQNEFHAHNEHVINLVTILLTRGKRFEQRYVEELDKYHNHMIHLCDLLVWFTR